ncbi:MAG: HAD family phosphatase [Bacilli bacterium]|nr:HAD family phosphatase [Bacilli bacterium]
MALICIDLDGTALKKGKPAAGVVETIRKLKENGHEIAIATGRSSHLLYDFDTILGVDHLVLANGGYVESQGQVIYERYIPSSVVKRLMEYCDQESADLVIEYEDGYLAYRKDTDIPDKFCGIFRINTPDIDRNFYPNRNVFSMLVFDSDKVDDMREKMPELQFNRSNAMGYDVNVTGGLKADGVEILAKRLGYALKDVYAIGDGMNDKQMLQLVGHGIAMGNSASELKEVAEYVTTDVMDFGVKNAMEHYRLI